MSPENVKKDQPKTAVTALAGVNPLAKMLGGGAEKLAGALKTSLKKKVEEKVMTNLKNKLEVLEHV